jgi:serine/threonine-protein kinase
MTGPDDDRTLPDANRPTVLVTTPSGGASSAATSSSGWLSSSGEIDHGRFTPGSVLGGRYRIVGRLGRGGMGEVYRADDLKLGQPVALKFLPPDVDRDPSRLTQLHTEVRMARQVSHPNVCRVYDIDEVDGHTFLSMEYVDGEDLASLLRRVGRFSPERALELAREVCAGLAAAHERDVVHRDFKPANVMIDGSGRARITDFGLAGASGQSIQAGTPAYMAPEQLAGAEVTPRSDIYALGLVLYELFTGRRAIEAKSLAELVRKREDAGIVLPSALVPDLDAAIDRTILRCLEREPSARPSSALAVSASLPGGDPLAAALAAGETPSPEMVAAAGEREALRALPAIAMLVLVLGSLVAIAALADRLSITGVAPVRTAPIVLADRARQIVQSLGYTDAPGDVAYGFVRVADYSQYLLANPAQATRDRLRSGRPAAIAFWYRTSPRAIVPTGGTPRVNYADPPYTVSGMIGVQLDPEGRLLDLNVVPPQVESAADAPAPESSPNWERLFEAADLKMPAFSQIAPSWTPRGHSDARAAWQGRLPGTEFELRVEAAAYRGRPVFFQLVGPWTRSARMPQASTARTTTQRVMQTLQVTLALGVLFGAVFVAYLNARKGRGDLRGALRLAAVIFGGAIATWVVGARHVFELGPEIGRLFDGVGDALWAAGTTWVLYIALEPYVRRFWPSTLISWSRLLAGRLKDPLVGRDILIGLTFAASVTLIERGYYLLLPAAGYGAPPPLFPRVADLEGTRYVVAEMGNVAFNTIFNAMWIIFFLVLLRLLFRGRVWLSALAGVPLFLVVMAADFQLGPLWLQAAAALLSVGLILLMVLRYGLLATTAFFAFQFIVSNAALTLDTTRWFFPTSMGLLAGVAAIAVYGFYAARGSEPLLGARVLD